MSMLSSLLARRRLIVATALLMAAAGIASWFTMPREEDPQFPFRDGNVIVRFPGADAATVERLVVEPIEERLVEVEEIRQVVSTARAGVAVIALELLESIYDTDTAWDHVREALDEAENEFPGGASEAVLDDEITRQDAIVLALVGSPDLMALRDAAETVRDALLQVDGVREIQRVADPGEQITIAYEDVTARQLGIDPLSLGSMVAGRSRIVPGGQVRLGSKTATLRPQTDFTSLQEIAATPIVLHSGAAIPLGALGPVRYGPIEPARERMFYRGERAVGLGIVPQQSIDLVAFGRTIRERLERVAPEIAPLRVEEVSFQPDQVDGRLADLGRSLLFSIAVVSLVLVLAMGPRLGLVVVVIVPLVTFASIALFAATGGILHQISIAALVIALGMLVDNAIVVAENMQYRIDQGDSRRMASISTVRELALPLGTATGTTLAAFVPMLISSGPTADFTRAIPTLIMLTLSISYLFAVMVTPVIGELVLRPHRSRPEGDGRRTLWIRRIASLSVRRAGWVLVAGALLIGLSMVAAGFVPAQFFPSADRALAVVELELPEGTHLDETTEVAARLERALAALEETGTITTFIGRSVPRFYYNLTPFPSSPHLAQMIVETTDLPAVETVIAASRDLARLHVPGASVVARRLEQGPPIDAPIEIRLTGDDLGDLVDAADVVLAALRDQPGARDVRHDGGLGVPTLTFAIDDAAAGRRGLAREDVAVAMIGRTLGTVIGQYRAGDDPVPIVLRSAAGERFAAGNLAAVDITSPDGTPVSLAEVAQPKVTWQPAAIYHRDGVREVRVYSQLAAGVTFSEVLDGFRPQIETSELPEGVELVYAGEAAESGRANTAILRALPLGTILLLFFLLAEFNSFRRVAIVLSTVPLAAVGVVPGLLISGEAFGFMSVLGVFSLVGIVVNNAIVLIDRVERRRAEGASLELALEDAVVRRTRPILLTMVTTVAGLMPLALSETSLWPPLAWAMISGLIASTFLTLLVVPALYKVLFSIGRGDWARGRVAHEATAVVMVLGLLAGLAPRPASAQPGQEASVEQILLLSLDRAMARAASRPEATRATEEGRAAALAAEATARFARRPVVNVHGDVTARDREFDFTTPLGALTLGEQVSQALVIDVVQPVYDPGRVRHAPAASAAREQSAAAVRSRTIATLRAEAADRYLAVLSVDARKQALTTFVESLRSTRAVIEKRVEAGRALRVDLLKIQLDLENALLDLRTLGRARQVALVALARAVGHDGPVDVEPLDRIDPAGTAGNELPTVHELLPAALDLRADLRAVLAEAQAFGFDASRLRAEKRPVLDAQANFTATEGDPFRPTALTTGALVVRWRPFAGGSRRPQIEALEARRKALTSEAEAIRKGVALELEQSLARLADARDAFDVRAQGVALATEALRVERSRHEAGRITINDLLAAEAALRDQETAHELARLEAVAAEVALDLARGALAARVAPAVPSNDRPHDASGSDPPAR